MDLTKCSKLSEEHRKKISEKLKGRKLPEEHRRKIGLAQTGSLSHWYGKHPSDETRKKLSSKRMGKKRSEETKRKISLSHLGLKPSDETRRKISATLKGRKPSEETRRKLSRSFTRNWVGNFQRKQNTSQMFKNLWENKDYREKHTKSILKGLFKRPTSLERQMLEIIEKNNLPYKYCGDGSFLIGYKNPDFINTDGAKICIEVANVFHHSDDYPERRKEHFKKWGWKCIVFRTNKLEEKEILEELLKGCKKI